MQKKYTRGEQIFFCAYILYFILSMLSMVYRKEANIWGNVQMIFSYVKPCMGLALFLKIWDDERYCRKEIIICAICIFVVLCSSRNSRDIRIVWLVFMALSMKNIYFDDILKIQVILQGVIFGITLFLASYGIIENKMHGSVVWGSTIMQGAGKFRYDLGFGHPNTASGIFLFLTMMYLCTKKNIKIIQVIIGIILNYLLYMQTGSRTSLLLTVIFLPFIYFINHKRNFTRFWKYSFIAASIAIPLIAMLAQIFYDPSNKLYNYINYLLSDRIQLGHDGFFEFGFTLFGQSINYYAGTRYQFVDCSYMRALLDFGLIFYCFFIIACFITMRNLVKAERKELCVIFFMWLIFGMVEDTMLNIAFQPICLLLGQMTNLNNKK